MRSASPQRIIADSLYEALKHHSLKDVLRFVALADGFFADLARPAEASSAAKTVRAGR